MLCYCFVKFHDFDLSRQRDTILIFSPLNARVLSVADLPVHPSRETKSLKPARASNAFLHTP
jgi:hypothetical protein